MSDKKQQEQSQPGGGAKKIGTVLIDVYENMEVNVSQFPTDHGMSMMVLGNALMAVNNWFIQNKPKNQSPIVMAKPGASPIDIEKMIKNN